MKKLSAALLAITLLMYLCNDFACADQVVTSGDFSITLSGQWLQGSNWYKQLDDSKELMFMMSSSFDSDEQELASYPYRDLDVMEKQYKKDDNFLSLEFFPVTLKGIKTGMLVSHLAGDIKVYFLSYSENGRGCYMSFRCNENVEISVSDLLSIAENIEFTGESNTTNQQSQEKNGLKYINFGNADVVPTGFRTKKSGKQNLLLIDFKWRNLSDDPSRFATTFSVTAFQDGIELKQGYDFSEETNSGTLIKKNVELECTEIFVLRNTTSEVSFTVDRILDFNDDYDDASYVITLSQ